MAIENRGFASMTEERRREIARMGGQASKGGGRKKKSEIAHDEVAHRTPVHEEK